LRVIARELPVADLGFGLGERLLLWGGLGALWLRL